MSADSHATSSAPGGAADDAVAAPLDLLLSDAPTSVRRRMNPGGSGLRLAAALALRPRVVARRGARLAGELAQVAAGRSERQPSRPGRPVTRPARAGHPVLG